MDSGTLGADNLREKHRWGDGNKVYTRKKNIAIAAAAATTTASATTTVDSSAATTVVATNKDNTKNKDDSNINSNDNQNKSDVAQQTSLALATEEANSSPQQQTGSRLDVASDDSRSHSRDPQDVAAPSSHELPNGNGVIKPVITIVDDRVRIDLTAAKSKTEIRELKRKLVSELDEVRSYVKKLEAKEVQLIGYSNAGDGCGYPYSQSQNLANGVVDRAGLAKMNSDVGSVGHHESRPFRQLSVSVVENNHGVGEFVEKEKRTPKANQYYHNSEFLLGKERLPPQESNKKLKSNSGRKHSGHTGYGFSMDKYMSQVFKSCSNLLARLMKHKHAWVFNKPVDAKALGLHDYHDIIKHPMDLGTIKSQLAKNWYKSPREFAEDVRLAFHNAMTYNPKGQDVHIMAEELLQIFEEKWAVIENDYNLDWRYEMVHEMILSTPTSRKAQSFPPRPWIPEMRTLNRPESMTGMMMINVDPKLRTSNFTQPVRTPVPKKPKAKDLVKRDMTYDEKQRLSTNLQNLPSEKLDNIVQIIKKRNSALSQHDDEIEVDIDSVDAETLWELDRFVTNYKKSLSKNKRKAERALQARAEAIRAVPATNGASEIVEPPKDSKTGEMKSMPLFHLLFKEISKGIMRVGQVVPAVLAATRVPHQVILTVIVPPMVQIRVIHLGRDCIASPLRWMVICTDGPQPFQRLLVLILLLMRFWRCYPRCVSSGCNSVLHFGRWRLGILILTVTWNLLGVSGGGFWFVETLLW